ncbi:UBX domain-containing protein 10 [Paramisgurnus dabryanus]|uniref:UBX domain-containing protein 10 n=1 Tax=Paramisgurnus dabryanus TaxID=90735 RepID=UPI0031F40631
MSSGEKMQVTRPKSSKGRSRPMMANFQKMETPAHYPTLLPQPPTKSNDRTNQHLRSQAVPRCRSQPSTEVLPEIFDRPPDEPSSLNRYRVLPSIEKKLSGNRSSSDVDRKASQMSQGDNSHRICKQQCASHLPTKAQGNARMRNVSNSPKTPKQSVVMPKGTGSKMGLMPQDEPDLLLAIRNPCGHRFKCNFHPTDKLQAVLSKAEAEFGENYENCIIETMDVPRRTFTNLTMTLAQCGILNKSVLCISQDGSSIDST